MSFDHIFTIKIWPDLPFWWSACPVVKWFLNQLLDFCSPNPDMRTRSTETQTFWLQLALATATNIGKSWARVRVCSGDRDRYLYFHHLQSHFIVLHNFSIVSPTGMPCRASHFFDMKTLAIFLNLGHTYSVPRSTFLAFCNWSFGKLLIPYL